MICDNGDGYMCGSWISTEYCKSAVKYLSYRAGSMLLTPLSAAHIDSISCVSCLPCLAINLSTKAIPSQTDHWPHHIVLPPTKKVRKKYNLTTLSSGYHFTNSQKVASQIPAEDTNRQAPASYNRAIPNSAPPCIVGARNWTNTSIRSTNKPSYPDLTGYSAGRK